MVVELEELVAHEALPVADPAHMLDLGGLLLELAAFLPRRGELLAKVLEGDLARCGRGVVFW